MWRGGGCARDAQSAVSISVKRAAPGPRAALWTASHPKSGAVAPGFLKTASPPACRRCSGSVASPSRNCLDQNQGGQVVCGAYASGGGQTQSAGRFGPGRGWPATIWRGGQVFLAQHGRLGRCAARLRGGAGDLHRVLRRHHGHQRFGARFLKPLAPSMLGAQTPPAPAARNPLCSSASASTGAVNTSPAAAGIRLRQLRPAGPLARGQQLGRNGQGQSFFQAPCVGVELLQLPGQQPGAWGSAPAPRRWAGARGRCGQTTARPARPPRWAMVMLTAEGARDSAAQRTRTNRGPAPRGTLHAVRGECHG